MPDIVVTEFMDAGPVEVLKGHYSVLVDAGLWNKRDELKRQLADAVAIIVRNRTDVNAELLAAAPKLRAVGRLGVGLDNIDQTTCKARGIAVCPAVGANAVSVAEYVIGSLLLLSRLGAYTSSAKVASGGWPREEAGRGREIAGRTLGIIGFGSIGQTVGAQARAMGLRTIAFDDYVPSSSAAWRHTESVSLDRLLITADYVTLHCPLTPETRGLIGARQLAAMKPGALLINTARGGIVDEAALAVSLRSGHLGGAALDVFAAEPIDTASAAIVAGIPNLILSPHVAGVTADSNARISEVTVENVMRALGGGR